MKFTDTVEVRQDPNGSCDLKQIQIDYSLEIVTRSYGIACIIPTILNKQTEITWVNGIDQEYDDEINRFEWRVTYSDSGNHTMGISISHAEWDIDIPNRLTIYFQTSGV